VPNTKQEERSSERDIRFFVFIKKKKKILKAIEQEENERAAREHMLQLSVREREELMRLEEERSRTRLMRERSKQTWAEQVCLCHAIFLPKRM